MILNTTVWANGEPCTLPQLLASWGSLVAQVEEGYAWCKPEFDNDIWCRGALAKVWPLLPPRVRAVCQPRLDGLDDRFRAATIPWPGHDEEPPQDWWHWRIPRLLEAGTEECGTLGWPEGWEIMPFPRPEGVELVE
ncbi:hypothetical protein ACFP1Z_06850 [Streptomyces gamaensis]|uniref:Uncharacterized protein n=1 Tax=Streptomyces gamaensis TaxID=1763542 RepID=A0ABW0YWS1_9ACTN